jgi:hypothetical protein
MSVSWMNVWKSQSQSYVTTGSQSVSLSVLVSSTHLRLTTRFLLLWDSCRSVDMGHSLWLENGSAIYNCCWSSPAQSFSTQSPGGLVTYFTVRFETPPTWMARSPYLYPPGTGWPSYTPRHWVLFLSPPTKSLHGSLYRLAYNHWNSSIVIETAIHLLLPAYSFPREYVKWPIA